MEFQFQGVAPAKLIILMVAGAIFAFAGLWLMFRQTPAGDAARIELFGIRFRSSSAGLLVFIVGALFLAAPVFVPEAKQPRSGDEDASEHQDILMAAIYRFRDVPIPRK
jgi:hypothetical protein